MFRKPGYTSVQTHFNSNINLRLRCIRTGIIMHFPGFTIIRALRQNKLRSMIYIHPRMRTPPSTFIV